MNVDVKGREQHFYNLTSRRRQNHIRVLRIGRNLCDPSIVATQGAAKLQGFSHLQKLVEWQSTNALPQH